MRVGMRLAVGMVRAMRMPMRMAVGMGGRVMLAMAGTAARGASSAGSSGA